MSNELTQLVEALDSKQDRVFLEAAMGASALMAWSDQEIHLNELSARDFCIDNMSRLKAFNPQEAADRFTHYVNLLRHDFEQGKAEILGVVATLASDEQAPLLMISMCIAIGKADYEFKPVEQAVLNDICEVMDVEPIEVMASFKPLADHRLKGDIDLLTGTPATTTHPTSFQHIDAWVDTLGSEQNRAFLEAAMGTSALMAWADQEVSDYETAARDFCLDTVNQLKSFDINEATGVFTRYVEALQNSPQQAKTEILETVARFSEDEQAKMLIISIGVAIAKADYDFNREEQRILHELCEVLGMTAVEAINSFQTSDYPSTNLDPLTGSVLTQEEV